jgi:uncharacterized membrane protein
MSRIRERIVVDAPIDAVYGVWHRLERLPSLMRGLKTVERLRDGRVRWTATVGGRTRRWVAEITEDVPSALIRWRSVAGAPNDGVVLFRRAAGGLTEVAVLMDVEPRSPIDQIGVSLGLLERRVRDDLERFKTYVEGAGRDKPLPPDVDGSQVSGVSADTHWGV